MNKINCLIRIESELEVVLKSGYHKSPLGYNNVG